MESLNTQVDDLKKDLQKCHQLSDDLQEQKKLVSQLKEQHSIESGKQKTKLEDACKHYQNTLKEEQNKLQLVIQDLEVSKSDVGRLQLETTKNQEALEAKESVIVELNGRVSGIEQKLTEAESEILSLEKSHAAAAEAAALLKTAEAKEKKMSEELESTRTAADKVSAELENLNRFAKLVEQAREAKHTPVANHNDRLRKVDRLLTTIKAFVQATAQL